jgi:hypothetical protein
MARLAPLEHGYRLEAVGGEEFCVLMHRVPCPEDCPDRREKNGRRSREGQDDPKTG